MEDAKQGRAYVDPIGNDTDEAGARLSAVGSRERLLGEQVDHPEQDIVVPIQCLRAGVTEVGEAGGAGGQCFGQYLGRGIGVAHAHSDTPLNGTANGVDGAGSLGCQRQEQGIRAGLLSQFLDESGGRIQHAGGIMGATVAWFSGKEGAFNVPAGDHALQQRRRAPGCAQLFEAPQQGGPGVGDQGEEEPTAAGASQGASGCFQIGGADFIALEIDTGEAIDLEIEQAGCDPGQRVRSGGAAFDAADEAGLVMDQDGLAGSIVPAVQDLCIHTVVVRPTSRR